MTTDGVARDVTGTPSPVRPTTLLLNAGICSGVLLAVDGALLDVVAPDSIVARVAGVVAIPLAVLGVIGLYLAVRHRASSHHLDLGLAANVVGMVAVGALAFSRNFILDPADDSTRDLILDGFPVVAALITAGVLAAVGFVALGSALLRHGAEPLPSWAYLILLPASGFAAQMPIAAAAVVQTLAAVAVIWLAVSERGQLVGGPSSLR